jgi:acetyl-CoA carboxylase carboxyl transferase subunit alpha
LIDGIIREPLGGAHTAPEAMAATLKAQIKRALAELKHLDPDERIELRINKYCRMGTFEDTGKV